MSKEDIKTLFEKHIPHVPELQRLHKWILSHNQVAATAILHGFLIYGWSYEELLASKTMVIVALKPHIKASSEDRRLKDSHITQPESYALQSNHGSTSLRDISDPIVIANIASSVANQMHKRSLEWQMVPRGDLWRS